MKKRLMFVLFMVALLCLSVFFVACSGEASEVPTVVMTDTETETQTETQTETEEPTETVTETETEEPETEDLSIPEEESVDYAALLDEWNKYLNSVGKTEVPTFSNASHIFSTVTNDNKYQSASAYGNVIIVKTGYYDKYVDGYFIPGGNDEVKVYNAVTGANILSFTDGRYVDFVGDHERKYEVDVMYDAIIRVTEYNLDLRYRVVEYESDGEIYQENVLDGWDYIATYSYYDSKGVALGEDLEQPATTYTDGTINIVYINDTAYHCKDGEIIYVSTKNNTYFIPEFQDEYKGYRYMYSDGCLQVINSQYQLVVNYTLPSRVQSDLEGYHILSNGDVYFYSLTQCVEEATEYDFVEYYNMMGTTYEFKFDVTHIVVSITTGEATEIDAPFVLIDDKLMSNEDKETTGIELDGDYQYAEILRIEDGKISDEGEHVILDSTLGEVATLPKVLKNQATLKKGMGDSLLLVEVINVSGSSASYVFDMSDGSMERYISPDREYTEINGGFIYEGKLYNDKLEELYDFTDISYEINNGAIMFTLSDVRTATEYNEETGEYDEVYETVYSTCVAYITETGELSLTKIAVDSAVDCIGGQLYRVDPYEAYSDISLFNKNGQEIHFDFSGEVHSINVIKTYDDSVLVKVESVHYDGYGYDTYTVYNYYIIK